MLDFHLKEAEKNLKLLDEQVGKPSVPNFPQTTNQAIVLVLKELTSAVRQMQMRLEALNERHKAHSIPSY